MSSVRLIDDQRLTTTVPPERVTASSGRELIIFADSSVMEVEKDVRRTADSLYFADFCSRRFLAFFLREDVCTLFLLNYKVDLPFKLTSMNSPTKGHELRIDIIT